MAIEIEYNPFSKLVSFKQPKHLMELYIKSLCNPKQVVWFALLVMYRKKYPVYIIFNRVENKIYSLLVS